MTGGGSQPAIRARTRLGRRRAWIFILPTLLVQGIVIAGPSLAAVYYSTTDWSGFGQPHFIGLENYSRLLFHDKDFTRALGNNVIYISFLLIVTFSMALVTASLLARVQRGGTVIRLLLFLPYVVPSVVVAHVWRLIMSPTIGLGPQLANIGIGGLDIAWLANRSTALLAIAFIDNWQFWPFVMIILLAAMQSVPKEVYEAARVDGADRWEEFRYLTLPLIRPTLAFMMLMTSIWGLLTFDYQWILTEGGPAGSTNVLGLLVYRSGIIRAEAGYGSAIGLTISILAVCEIGLYLLLRRRLKGQEW
jgi:raffinose/stachyose/melibiose transport system permease protein